MTLNDLDDRDNGQQLTAMAVGPMATRNAEAGEATRVGTLLDERYVLTRELGSGGFATVYEGVDLELGGRVAVKVLTDEYSRDPELVARFGQEVELVRALRHPNTIAVWDVGIAGDGAAYMVMELVAGRTLTRVIDDDGPMTVERAVAIVLQILRSLSEAHELGIVHRDLKPDNVMLSDLEDDPDFVRTLDFGVAKALAQEVSAVRTQTGVVVGTPGYTAPEVLLGEPATPAADVYSVGLILVELLRGEPAVAPASAARMVADQLALDPVEITSDLEDSWLAPVIRRALARDPASRLGSARAMRHAILDAESRHRGDPATAWTTADDATYEWRPVEGDSESDAAGSSRDDVPAIDVPRFRVRELLGLLTLSLLAVAALLLIPHAPRATVGEGRKLVGGEGAVAGDVKDALQSEIPPEEPDLTASAYVPLSDLPGESVDEMDWDWLGDGVAAGVDDGGDSASEGQLALAREPVSDVPGAAGPPGSVDPAGEARELYVESATIAQEAIDLLEGALERGQVEPSQRAASTAQLVDLYEQQVADLLSAGLCDGAVRRAAEAESAALRWADASPPDFAELEAQAADCQARASQRAEPWEPRLYLALVQSGSDLYDQARAIDPGELERAEERESLLRHSVAAHRRARAMLADAMEEPELGRTRAEVMAESLQWLDRRVVALECARDRCSAAQLHLDSARAVVDAGAAPRDRDLGAAAQIDACRQRVAAERPTFSWGLLAELLALGRQIREQALALSITPEPRFHAVVSITSEPSRARVVLNGERMGRTPFRGTIEGSQPRVELLVGRTGYERVRLVIELQPQTGSAAGPEIDEHVVLEPDHPFGQVGTYSDRLRERL